MHGAKLQEQLLDSQDDEKKMIEKARQRINRSVRRDSRETMDSSDIDKTMMFVGGGGGYSVLGSKRFSMQPSTMRQRNDSISL